MFTQIQLICVVVLNEMNLHLKVELINRIFYFIVEFSFHPNKNAEKMAPNKFYLIKMTIH